MGVTFRVVATPSPKGSMRAFTPPGWTRPVLTSTSRDVRVWEHAVREAAVRAIGAAWARETGVHVAIEFVLTRPKALPKTKDRDHTTKPDLDKLTRAVLDALIGVAYVDDAQVCALACRKRYAGLTEQPGAIVTVDRAGREAPDSILELATMRRP